MKSRPDRILTCACLLAAAFVFCPTGNAGHKCPVAPGQPGWLELQMESRESLVGKERNRAIRLLRGFLKQYPEAPQRADVLFRLAELYWENAEARFLDQMSAYDEKLDAFRTGSVKKRPPEPRIDLTASLKIYEEILEKHTDFQHSDTVLYLYGFGLNEQGQEQAALSIYRTLLKKYPKSSFAPDAFLAIGEYHFAKGQFQHALKAYDKVLAHPGSPLTDLALYKTAWCYFKLGKAKRAARRFKKILYRAEQQQAAAGGDRIDAAAVELKKEALEDLALTFSESGGAKEAYRFMEQVGGEEYSIKVLRSLGDVFFRQARYKKAIDSYRILVERFPLAVDAPEHRVRIAEAFERAGMIDKALAERRQIATSCGPGSSWARKHSDKPEAMADAKRIAEESLRYVALYRHKQAQAERSKKAYQASALAYREYLEKFPDSPAGPKMHFYLGEVLFKLKRYAKAAEHYIRASKNLTDKGVRIEAAYAAVLSFDKLRKKFGSGDEPPAKQQELSNPERGFVRAVDEFARLAPEDKKVPQLRFEQGQTFYYRGRYKQAAQQFLALVQNHPQDEYAEPAADLALDCFSRTRDWKNLENRARRLMQLKTFDGKDLGDKLPGFIAAAIFQSGTSLAKADKHEAAAAEYQRLVSEFPGSDLAPKSLFLAAVNLEEAGRKSEAVETYQKIIKRYPKRAADATYVIAGIYERKYDYKHAAKHYVDFASRYPEDERAPEALLQAAMLNKARRAHMAEAKVLERFTTRFPRHPKTPAALFQSGLALERASKHRQAERTFSNYLKKYARRDKRVREATLHLGQALLKLKKRSRASKMFAKCGAYRRRHKPRGSELASAAQCLFMQGEMVFDEYQKIKLRPPKQRLVRRLKEKAALLKKAEGMFTKVVAAGHMEWASAALYRIGDMYAKFAQAIYKAPMPKGLKGQELEVYRMELQSLAFPIEDKALKAFTISHEMALKHGYFSQWSRKTIDELRKLDPGKYPEEDEVRPSTAWADSFTTFPLVMKKIPLPRPKAVAGDKGGKRR